MGYFYNISGIKILWPPETIVGQSEKIVSEVMPIGLNLFHVKVNSLRPTRG